MTRPLIAYPKSFDEITQAFENWRPGRRGPHIELVRLKSKNVLVLRSKPQPNVRIELRANRLVCELAGSTLQLVLTYFEVSTRLDKGYFSCEFKMSQASGVLKDSIAAAENSRNPVFIARAINAITGLEHEIPQERIEEASTASTDYQVLLAAMTEPSVATQLAVNDPLAAAKIRGVERQREMLKNGGGVLTVSGVEKLLGISRQAVHKRQTQRQLIGLTLGRRGYAYPAWQFEEGKTLPHLATVLQALGKHDPWMQMTFFLGGNDRLDGRRPIDVLKAGEVEPVLRAAESYGEQGAA
ncbi:MAG TPA: hypothetical protein VMP12_06785 [Candidatus Sulfotelmatobacter sp.]|nr:hypothetical protein [Candidatus Sulfotelmatobacter sp.]